MNKVAIIDCESTGTDTSNDRIVQIAVFLCDMNLNKKSDTIHSLINPQVDIPAESTEIHGITNEDVINAPKFSEIGPGFLNMIEGCHIAGYNVKFDILLLMNELSRIGLTMDLTGRMILDPYTTLVKMEPRDQSTIYKQFTGKDLDDAHDAAADISATHEIMLAQMAKYNFGSLEDMYKVSEPENQCDLSGKIKMKNGQPVFNFGKHYEKPIADNKPYLNWMLSADMPSDTKTWIENYLNRNQDGS